MTSKATALINEINHAFKDVDGLMLGDAESLETRLLPSGIIPIDVLLNGGFPRARITEIYGAYCVVPDTLVLTDALTWAPAGELLPDYGLIGFDEEVNQGRGRTAKMRPAQVEHIGNKRLECVRVITDKGEITVSLGHGFVARHRSQHSREWRTAQQLKVGDSLLWTCEPWKQNLGRDAGYVAGIFDGEGWMDKHRLSFAQNPGLVLDEAVMALKRLGFEVTVRSQGDGLKCMRVAITGGRWETLRALGQLRCVRFLDLATNVWVGGDLTSKGPHTDVGSAAARVEAIERVGRRDVVTMQTSTRTFIANGFPSHNSTMKTYIAMHAIATTQKAGGICALVDTERSFDPAWATKIGVDIKELVYLAPLDGEEAVDVVEALVLKGVDMVVWDSVAATLPRDEREKQMHGEHVQPGRLAALMSVGLKKINSANKSTALVFINQTRMNLGVRWGSKETTPGGRALGFYASHRLEFKLTGREREGDGEERKITAIQVTAHLMKSKLTQPYTDERFTFDLNTGVVDELGWLIGKGLEEGVIQKSGGYLWLGTEKKAYEKAFRQRLTGDPTTLMRLEESAVSLPSSYLGQHGLGSRTVAEPNVPSPKPRVVRRTPVAAQAPSKVTSAPKTKSSKSKTGTSRSR